MAVEDDIKAELENQSIAGSGTDWEIKAYRFTDNQDKQVLINPTAGQAPQPHSDTNRPRIQIRVRGDANDAATAKDKADEIFGHFRALKKQDINSTNYGGIRALDQPSFLRTDDKDREEFVLNLQALRSDV